MRVLVTGATGLVGSHVVEALLAAGMPVRALVRPARDTSQLASLGAEIARGDLRDAPSLARAARGVDAIVHNAAAVGDWGRWREFARVGVDGTRALLVAARDAGVRRWVQMSSIAVHGYLRVGWRRVHEATGFPRLPALLDAYVHEKIASEQLVQRAAREGAVRATVLRPPAVYGEGDRAFLPRLADLLTRRRVVLPAGGRHRAHVIWAGDVAAAVRAALAAPAAEGRSYELDGPGDLTQRQVLDHVADGLGLPRADRAEPLPVAYVAALASELGARLRRSTRPPDRTRMLVGLMGGRFEIDTTRARRELGWAPRMETAAGLSRACEAWLGAAVSPEPHRATA